MRTNKERFETLMMRFQNDVNAQFDKFIFLLNDNSMVLPKAIIAWTTIEVSNDFNIEAKDLKDDWKWCWQFCKFDLNSFAKIMEINTTEAKDLIGRMSAMKFIYPDGTINNIAHNIIKSIIKKGIEKSTGQSIGKSDK